jgi:hypothetical protein
MFADGRAPGDLGFDPLGCGKNPEAFARRQVNISPSWFDTECFDLRLRITRIL